MRICIHIDDYSKMLNEYNEFYYRVFINDKSEINYMRKEMYENFLSMVTFEA